MRKLDPTTGAKHTFASEASKTEVAKRITFHPHFHIASPLRRAHHRLKPKPAPLMPLDFVLEEFPKTATLDGDLRAELRPLESHDEDRLLDFFAAIPPRELLFVKHRVTERPVIHDWCANIDLERNFPLLALRDAQILGVCTLHQQLGGWKRHIGRVSVHVHPDFRGRGLARTLVTEVIEIARQSGLERIEAEFVGAQETGMKTFAHLGFAELFRLPDYVKDMQAINHDYVLMGLELITDEEYAGMG